MNLNDITNYIQSICENISNILDVDVTLVTKDLVRIAGTGIFKDKIGERISKEAIYFNVLKEGKYYLINKELNNECDKCCHKQQCKELADICTPVKLGNEILGVLGIAAFNEEQKNKFISKNKDLIEGLRFVDEPSTLRFFIGKLEPVSDWANKLEAKFKEDFGDSL